MNNVLQVSIVAFFLLALRFGLSFIDLQLQIDGATISISLIGFAAVVLLGFAYAAYRRWDFRVTIDVVIATGAVLIAFAPPPWASYVLALNLLMIGWCMHVTGRFW